MRTNLATGQAHSPLQVTHLGCSGLLLRAGELRLAVDPPGPLGAPTLLTWSEAERVAGAQSRAPLAARAELLDWLGRTGCPLPLGEQVCFEGMTLRAWPYRPIPYATPREALRKTLSALREPEMAQARLAYTLARPPALPIAVELQMGPWRVGLLGQALHRFLGGARRVALLDSFRDLDLLVVGTDFDDERACGELMVALRPRQALLADLVGPVRRTLGLPTRPLAATLQHAPADTVPLASSQSHLFQWRPA